MHKIGIAWFLCGLLILACNRQETKQPSTQRLVITSPELAETIAHLVEPSKIVGITLECDYPKTILNTTKVGSFGKVDLEKVTRLNPSHIFTTKMEQDIVSAELKKLSLPVYSIFINSYHEYPHTIQYLGEILKAKEQADSLANWVEAQIQLFSEKDYSQKPSVYVEIYGFPLMTAAKESLVGELIELSGGKNLFDSLPREYCRINPEEVIKLNPEIILLLYPNVSIDDVSKRKGWQAISAVKENRIYEELDPDLILRATPRTLKGIKQLVKIIHE